jgi:hypothetical protein
LIFGESITTDGLSLVVARAISMDEWSQAVEMLSGLSTASPFWLGDLLELGEREYGEKYAQGIPDDISPATLRGYQWVSARIPPANRRPGLSWSHHRAVSALEPVEQLALLDQAEAEGWSVAELRRRAKGQGEPVKPRVFKVESYDITTGGDIVRVSFTLPHEAAVEINARLQAGKRVTFET